MWQDLLARLTTADKEQSNIFWPEVDRKTEMAMLHSLFRTAIAGNVLSDGQVEQFVREIVFMTEGCDAPEDLSQLRPSGLNAATRNLLNMDEKLSPYSLMMFDRKLLQDLDREMLKQELETVSGAAVYVL